MRHAQPLICLPVMRWFHTRLPMPEEYRYRRPLVQPALRALAVALSLIATPALAEASEDTLRLLIRVKSSIETGVSLPEFRGIVRQLDEHVQLSRATKAKGLSTAQLDAAEALVIHLRGVVDLWNYVIMASHCRDRMGYYDILQIASCKYELRDRLSSVGLKLADFSKDDLSINPQIIFQEAVGTAHRRVETTLKAFTGR